MSTEERYDPESIEPRWQQLWAHERTWEVSNADDGREKAYVLEMLPYPSGDLHVGHAKNYMVGDAVAHFERRQGRRVLHPMGYDAFGLPAENHAIKTGVHPRESTERAIASFQKQFRSWGISIDWARELSTCEPDYYRWTQWIFLQMFRAGLAYRKAATVNWDPVEETVLANEQVVDGRGERSGALVEVRHLEQWFFRITDYADRLVDDLDTIDWPEHVKTMQRNWIGRSTGAQVSFRCEALGIDYPVFTTRPDTLFGATFFVVAPEHPDIERLAAGTGNEDSVRDYVNRALTTDKEDRGNAERVKTGVPLGQTVTNPVNGEQLPMYVADYVLMEYGTGAIMAVPGHDERDFEFAKVFDLSIVRVVAPADADAADKHAPLTEAYTASDNGTLVNSGTFSGLGVTEAKPRIVEVLAGHGSARPVVNYRLHDWCISRQRYWGPPIPIIYCEKCGAVPVPEEDLPVELPYVEDFKPDDTGISPLARVESWYRVACPTCGGEARRETDVSDTFLDSAWYFLRYPSSDLESAPFDGAITKKWLPVTSYIGGNEHAVLHLLYSRFTTMVLHDAGLIEFEEPFTKFRAHGMIIRDGAKMSKSRGNVVNPDEYIERWGADTFRTYLMFLGPYEEGGDFRDQSVAGVRRFLDRLWASVLESAGDGQPDADVMRKLHQTIRKVSDDIPVLSYNTAIAAMMEYMNTVRRGERKAHRAEVEPLVQLVCVFAPHLAEELWERLGHAESIFDAGWPAFDASLAAESSVTIAVQVRGKTRGTVQVAAGAGQEDALAAAMADPTIAKFVTGAPKKIVFVPGRLLNVVL